MSDYWKNRRDLKYLRRVVDLARTFVPGGGHVLDVGGRDCEYILWFDWFSHKSVLDIRPAAKLDGVESIRADFRDYKPPRQFDLVTCLQVLEHLDDPAPFMRKLLATGRVLIASVPYRWPKGACRWHRQDPVDDRKLDAWAGRAPSERRVVTDRGVKRLIAVYVCNGARGGDGAC